MSALLKQRRMEYDADNSLPGNLRYKIEERIVSVAVGAPMYEYWEVIMNGLTREEALKLLEYK